MKSKSINTRLFSTAVILILVLVVIGLVSSRVGGGVEPVPVASQNYSKKYLVEVSKDSLENHLHKKYGENVSTRLLAKYSIQIQNQGAQISNFYNHNDKMLQIKSHGFDIKKVDNNTLVANFDTTKYYDQVYVKVPTDVLYGILAY